MIVRLCGDTADATSLGLHERLTEEGHKTIFLPGTPADCYVYLDTGVVRRWGSLHGRGGAVPSRFSEALEEANRHRARMLLVSLVRNGEWHEQRRLRQEEQLANAATLRRVVAQVARVYQPYGLSLGSADGHSVVSCFIEDAVRYRAVRIRQPRHALHWPLHLTDVVDAVYRLLMSDLTVPVHIAARQGVSSLELVAMIRGSLRGEITIQHDDVPAVPPPTPPDERLTSWVLGWEPTIPLEAGVTQMVAAAQFRRAKEHANDRSMCVG